MMQKQQQQKNFLKMSQHASEAFFNREVQVAPEAHKYHSPQTNIGAMEMLKTSVDSRWRDDFRSLVLFSWTHIFIVVFRGHVQL